MVTMTQRDGRERVIVVLDGIGASEEKSGVAPLRYALRDLVRPKDEVLVLTILNSEAETNPSLLSNNAGCCSKGDELFEKYPSEGDSYIEFLHEEISQRREAYKQIFRPFYDRCKTGGVKFQVKIVPNFEPKAIVSEEANNVDATWIIMDRCFECQLPIRTNCNVTLVTGDGNIVVHKKLLLKDGAEDPFVPKIKPSSKSSSNQDKGLIVSPEDSHVNQYTTPDAPSTSRGCENLTTTELSSVSMSLRNLELSADGSAADDDNNYYSSMESSSSDVNLVVRMPLHLSWAMVEEMTVGFTRMTCLDYWNENFRMYLGHLSDHRTQVLVKRFTRQLDCVLEAEKRATLSVYHKNILGLIAFHKSNNGTVLIYPFTRRWTLDRFLHGLNGKQVKLTFQEKIKIAIGIGQGVRYMHEECPRGPIVHGDLTPCNIFLNFENLEPQITGFGQAKWLQLKQGLPISSNRYRHKDPSDIESLALVKSDIFQFGILLLRLFCRRSAPRDDQTFVEWARPLLQNRAYPLLLEDDLEYPDVYGIVRVMFSASQCIKAKLISRPSMSEVISLLNGETSCAMQFSPSSEDSPNMDLSVQLHS